MEVSEFNSGHPWLGLNPEANPLDPFSTLEDKDKSPAYLDPTALALTEANGETIIALEGDGADFATENIPEIGDIPPEPSASNRDPVTGEVPGAAGLTGSAADVLADVLFDSDYYARQNQDLALAGLTTPEELYKHFHNFGLPEGRLFSLFTSLSYYVENNPDLAAAGLTEPEQQYEHLRRLGLSEGRRMSPWLDLKFYLQDNPDLQAAFAGDTELAFIHLKTYGLVEGRRFSPEVDLDFYLNSYSDLGAAFGDNQELAFEHWQRFGFAEGRRSLPEIPEIPEIPDTFPPISLALSELFEETANPEPEANGEPEDEGIASVPWPNVAGNLPEAASSPVTSPDSEEDETSGLGQSADSGDNQDNSSAESSSQLDEEPENEGEPNSQLDEEPENEDNSGEPSGNSSGNSSSDLEEDEGTASVPDEPDEFAEKLNPVVTRPQTLAGLEAEPTPPLDLPENAGGKNAKKNPSPKHLQIDASQEEYYRGGTARLNGWVFDAWGASDVERVEFSLHKTGEQWQDIDSWTSFNISGQDDRWAYFDYSLFGLEPGKYQIKGFAYDREGGKSNAAVAHFSVGEENPLPVIGVVDTGFNEHNEDIDYSRATLGRDWVDGDDNPLLADGEGSEHGTHVLGIIGATQNNGVGIYGMNDQAPLFLSRAIGSGQWAEALMEFVDYALASAQPNAVANLSLDLTQVESDGSIKTRYEFTPQEREALEYARQNGVLVVVAAGNDGSVMSVLGQASQEFDNIITVGAANDNQRASYSSYGRRGPDIMAEGGSVADPIVSTAGEDTGTMAGTSVAAAQVTGAASLVWEANPDLNYRQVIEALKSTATDLNVAGEDSETGAGLLNPEAAVAAAAAMAPEVYAPEAFLTPDTWGGEGLVTPEERAVADEFNGQYYDWVPYTIQSGDTLSQIALDTMGDSSEAAYNFIAQHNGIADPHSIDAGATIEIPVEVSPPPPEEETGPGDGSTPEEETNPGDGSTPDEEEPNPDDGSNPDEEEPNPGDEEPNPSGDGSNTDNNPEPPPPPSSTTIAGHTIAGDFYPVFQDYRETLGNPISGEKHYSDGVSYQLFENGSIVSSPNGAYPLYGGIRQEYLDTGGLNGNLGAPTSGEIGLGGGNIIQYFENGYIYWNGSKATAYGEGDGLPSDTVQSDELGLVAVSRPGVLIRTGGDDGVADNRYIVSERNYDRQDYTGEVWTRIRFNRLNEEHKVSIYWADHRWEAYITPKTEEIELIYTKRFEDSNERVVAVTIAPSEEQGAQDVTGTEVENGRDSAKGPLFGSPVDGYLPKIDINQGQSTYNEFADIEVVADWENLDAKFIGTVADNSVDYLRSRSDASTEGKVVGAYPELVRLGFDDWKEGTKEKNETTGKEDSRWLKVQGTEEWVSAAYIDVEGELLDTLYREYKERHLRVENGQLTFDSEGNDNENSIYFSRIAHWPGGASGVTIGRGYDLGQKKKNKILQDLKAAGIADDDAEKFSEAAGLTGEDAKDFLEKNKANLPVITLKQQKELFSIAWNELYKNVQKISAKQDVVDKYGSVNWEKTNPAIRDVVVDLRYRGDYTPTTSKKVQPLLVENDLERLLALMKDRNFWKNVPKDRFERRIDHLEATK